MPLVETSLFNQVRKCCGNFQLFSKYARRQSEVRTIDTISQTQHLGLAFWCQRILGVMQLLFLRTTGPGSVDSCQGAREVWMESPPLPVSFDTSWSESRKWDREPCHLLPFLGCIAFCWALLSSHAPSRMPSLSFCAESFASSPSVPHPIVASHQQNQHTVKNDIFKICGCCRGCYRCSYWAQCS